MTKRAGNKRLQLYEWRLCPGPWLSPEVAIRCQGEHKGGLPLVPGFTALAKKPVTVYGTETDGCWISRVFSGSDNEGINATLIH